MPSTLSAIRLDVDGALTDLQLPAGGGLLPALRSTLDGGVEIAHYARPNGTGRLAVAVDGAGAGVLPPNLYVTSLLASIRHKRLPYLLYGPVVLLGALDGAGEHTDVPAPLRGSLPQIVAALATRYRSTG